MPIPSAQPVTIEPRPGGTFPLLWIDSVFIDASRRQDAVPVMLSFSNFSQPTPESPREFAPGPGRPIRVPDLYALAGRNATIAAGVQGFYAAVMEIERMSVEQAALKAQLPATDAAAREARAAATAAQVAATQARWIAGTVARLDAEILALTEEQTRISALPADDPERESLPWIEQRITDAESERTAAALTALEDEAAAVAAEADAMAADAAALQAETAMAALVAAIEALEL